MTKHDKSRGDRILEVIDDFTVEYGYAPSVREIMVRVGLASTSAVMHHLVRLEKAGRLNRTHGIARAITPGPTTPDPVRYAAEDVVLQEGRHDDEALAIVPRAALARLREALEATA